MGLGRQPVNSSSESKTVQVKMHRSNADRWGHVSIQIQLSHSAVLHVDSIVLHWKHSLQLPPAHSCVLLSTMEYSLQLCSPQIPAPSLSHDQQQLPWLPNGAWRTAIYLNRLCLAKRQPTNKAYCYSVKNENAILHIMLYFLPGYTLRNTRTQWSQCSRATQLH